MHVRRAVYTPGGVYDAADPDISQFDADERERDEIDELLRQLEAEEARISRRRRRLHGRSSSNAQRQCRRDAATPEQLAALDEQERVISAERRLFTPGSTSSADSGSVTRPAVRAGPRGVRDGTRP